MFNSPLEHTSNFTRVSNDFSSFFLVSHSSLNRNLLLLFIFLLFSRKMRSLCKYTLMSGLIVCVHGKISIQSTCSLCIEQIYSKLETTGRFRFPNSGKATATKTKYRGKCPIHNHYLYVIHNLERMTAQPKLFSMLQTFFSSHFFLSLFRFLRIFPLRERAHTYTHILILT